MGRRIVIEADGASRGNPGPAGYGARVRDADTGELLAEVASPIGEATNNVAEYRGLIAGLEAAAAIDPTAAVEVRMDSKLVVEQMSGRWKIKHPALQPLARQARQVAASLASVTYRWVPREQNAQADRLANEALDGAVRNWSTQRTEPVQAAEPVEPPVDQGKTDGTALGWGPADTNPTRLLLLRHGQTPMSVERRFAGIGDIPLTEVGHEQAKAAARRLAQRPVDVVVSSPLRRTLDTAQYVAKECGLDVEVEEDFREADFGAWEGMTFAEARKHSPQEFHRWLSDPHVPPPGGESFAEVSRRVTRARDRVLARHRGRTVVVVTHVTPIKLLVQQAMLAPLPALYRMHLDVACLCEVHCFSDGPMVVRSLNDTGHLAC
ncbi:bifunctional RNase H/acid phosphatase [Thermobifida fusca]|uniref:Bifunctional RNase H/acid phosphatase n=2 Tax=Thermobifida fusca TaxID=2021 RepID=A0A9P2T9K5_THEFU|nr:MULTISPECIES: bifunctional RNase H/acid phosphatase [Thermobifida]EOR71032.1 bifunctional RNase H/acid phosphatase [Thermobifida fusca TM51]MBO2530577.1 bifunctional RNase H/acid phosphatase [Thermobifida sp.]MDD6791005.1 bifunctional RNase H/acid phosphatase [Thermobifida fusca]PPS91950.1 acid phosphatase [Thermobifida fusca]PZN61058.1 MAG: bifunctional RNase H/acid phosphatase [Thermobifida fusca]